MQKPLKLVPAVPNQMFLCLLAGLFSTFALCSKTLFYTEFHSDFFPLQFVELLWKACGGFTVLTVWVLAGVTFMIYKVRQLFPQGLLGRAGVLVRITAALFAVFVLVGRSYASLDSWDYVIGSPVQLLLAIVVGAGLYLFFSAGLSLLLFLADRQSGEPVNLGVRQTLLIFWVIWLCWLPYLVISYPGNVPYDGYRQLNMYYGYNSPTNHHPWLSTLIMGWITSLGRGISDNFGVFLFVFLQSILCAAVFAAVCRKICTYSISRWIKLAAVLFYAVLPAWGNYASTLIKDTLYYAVFSLYGLLYISFLEKRPSAARIAGLLIVACLVVQLRNEGVYIVAASLLFLLIASHAKAVCVVILAVTVVFHVVVNNAFYASGVARGSAREMLSLPLQQVARYLLYYPEDVSGEERELLNQVVSADRLAELYDPVIADPVKDTYKNPDTGTLMQFFSLYVKMGLRHPGCYVQAALNQTFGYFYPAYLTEKISNLQFYIKGAPLATGDMNIYYVRSDETRRGLSNYGNSWRDYPGVALLNPGTYTWLTVLCGMYLILKRRHRALAAVSLPLLTIAVAMVSPVNGYLRYMLPVMAFMPLLLAYCLNRQSENNVKDVGGREAIANL